MQQRKPYFRAFDGWWYVQLRVGGKRIQRKLVKGEDQETEAWRLFYKVMAEEEGTAPAASSMRIAQLFDLFLDAICPYADKAPEKQPKTHDLQPPLRANATHDVRTYWWYRKFLQSFSERCGTLLVLDLKPFHVSKWLDAHPAWTTSRRCAVICVKRAYNWAEGEGIIPANPAKKIRKPPPVRRERILTPEERQLILTTIKDRAFSEFVYGLLETGCRPGEVRKITAAQVNLDLGVWILEHHKTRKKTGLPRVVYLTPGMIELCRKLVVKFPEGPIFRGPRGNRPFSRNAVRCRFRRLRKKLPQLKGVISYTLRHTWITDALANGVPAATVAELAGHKDLKMIQEHYSHLSEKRNHLQEAVKKATGYASAPPPRAEAG